jgi:hypothetical protein
MQKWEYRVERAADGLRNANVANLHGAEGWELVAVVQFGTEAVLYFKRQKET